MKIKRKDMEKRCKCNNVGACTRAGKVFVFKDEDAEFVCPECGEPLEEVKSEDSSLEDAQKQLKAKKRRNAIIMAVATIAVLTVVVGGITLLGNNGENTEKQQSEQQSDPLKVAAAQKGDSIIKANEAKLAENKEKVKAEFVKILIGLLDKMHTAVDDSVIEDVESLELSINTAWDDAFKVVSLEPKDGGSPAPKPQPVGTSGTKDLGYAVYKGTLKNGMPDGVNGRLTFKTQHVIDSKDPKGRMAEPGDYVIGEFVQGHLVQGRWYSADNTLKEGIMIGM